ERHYFFGLLPFLIMRLAGGSQLPRLVSGQGVRDVWVVLTQAQIFHSVTSASHASFVCRNNEFSCTEKISGITDSGFYGTISIGVPASTACHISSISGFVTAMQPLVQLKRCVMKDNQPNPLR